MNFDPTTFALEVLNFLVLVWLLQRFFYRPVLDVIERRRAEGAAELATARTLQEEAQAVKADYEARAARLSEERERALARLDAEMALERSRRLAELDSDMKTERSRREELEADERKVREIEREKEAIALAARFTARLLDRVAGPEIEGRLVEMAQADLQSMDAGRRAALQDALARPGTRVRVASAYALDAARRAKLVAALSDVAGLQLAPEFSEDRQLKAGLCIMAGPWELTASLRDELAFFSESPIGDD